MSQITPAKARYEEYKRRALMQWGFVYLLQCASTGWHKIGWTLKPVTKRLEEIRSEFNVGFDWQLVTKVYCWSPPRVEWALHTLLHAQRITSKREWFVLDDESAKALRTLMRAWSYEMPTEEESLDFMFEVGVREGFTDGEFWGRLWELDDAHFEEKEV